MAIKDTIRGLFGGLSSKNTKNNEETFSKRGFTAGKQNRLTGDWEANNVPPNQEIRASLRVMRSRSRDLAKNNDYIKRFLSILEHNVIGADGIRLQALSRDPSGSFDKAANQMIEAAWKVFSKRKNLDTRQLLAMREFQALVLKTMAIDGECFIRKVKNYKHSAHGIAMQLVDAAFIDERLNMPDSNIIMGIKYDEWGRAIGYCVRVQEGFSSSFSYDGLRYQIVPASEMLHLFLPNYVDQGRGVPWLHTVTERLHHLDGYEKAELVGARAAAGKMGFIKTEDGDNPLDDGDVETGPVMDADPGTIHRLNTGESFEAWDPKHPGGNYGTFIEACLRGIASGLEVSYVSLANDLKGVSYSSIRSGMLAERDVFKRLQNFLSEYLLTEIYEEWLPYALLSRAIPLPMSKLDKFLAVKWQPRGWDWVDPLKDIQASIMAVNANLTSRREIIESQGGDLEEVWQQLADEQALSKELGLDLNPELTMANAAAEAQAQAATEASAQAANTQVDEAARSFRNLQDTYSETLRNIASKPVQVEIKQDPIQIELRQAETHVHLTQERAEPMPAPIVNVNVPETVVNVAAPVVNVEPAQVTLEAELNVKAEMPARRTDTVIERDENGSIKSTYQIETDI